MTSTESKEIEWLAANPFGFILKSADPTLHVTVPPGTRIAECWMFSNAGRGILPNVKPAETMVNALEGMQTFFKKIDSMDQPPEYLWGSTPYKRTANFSRLFGFDVIEHPDRFGYYICTARTDVVREKITEMIANGTQDRLRRRVGRT